MRALAREHPELVTAQHDRVVASYGVLNSVGRLSPQVLDRFLTALDPQIADLWRELCRRVASNGRPDG